jgi:hypothetical protein
MGYEETSMARLLALAKEVESFVLHYSPDDPDGEYAYVKAFKALATRFVAAVRRIRNDDLQQQVATVKLDIDSFDDAAQLQAELTGIIDYLKDLASHPELFRVGPEPELFVDASVIKGLRAADKSVFDLSRVAHICTELNSCFGNGNYIACTLLLRTILNHLPPVFGHTTFSQVVAHAGRSTKDLWAVLDEVARDVADYQAHGLVGKTQFAPTKSQIEPFRAPLEVLLHEVIRAVDAG